MTLFTILKPAVMILVILGSTIFTVYHIKRCDTFRKSFPELYDDKMLRKKKWLNIAHGVFNTIICIMLFLVAFPQLKFFCIYKFICVVLFSIGGILYYQAYYDLGADLSGRAEPDIKKVTEVALAAIFMPIRMCIIALALWYSITGNYIPFLNNAPKEFHSSYSIELESLGKTKITHIKDTNQYIFITNEDGSPKLNICEFEEKNIEKNGSFDVEIELSKNSKKKQREKIGSSHF